MEPPQELRKRFGQQIIDQADAADGQQLAVGGQPERNGQGHEIGQNRFNVGQQDGEFLWHDADAKALPDQFTRHHPIVGHHLELRPGQGKAARVQPGDQSLDRGEAYESGVRKGCPRFECFEEILCCCIAVICASHSKPSEWRVGMSAVNANPIMAQIEAAQTSRLIPIAASSESLAI